MKTVNKALDVLEVFLVGGKEISISEIASITGQNVSTIHGILDELSKRGYIRQQQKWGKYSLGPKFLSFSSAIHRVMAIEDVWHPFMVELNKEFNETVDIAIRDGYYAVSVSMILSTHRLRVVTDIQAGGKIAMYCTGVGKIFLAAMSDRELREYLNSEQFTSFTTNTITDTKELKKHIQKVRQEGIAYDMEECEIGLRNVAAPILDYNGGVVAAIGILGPSVRLTSKRMKEIAPVVKGYAVRISEAIKFQGKPI